MGESANLPDEQRVSLHVNGEQHVLDVPPDATLLHVLRNELGLRGVKAACESGRCGACAVLLDGVVAPSCRVPVKHVRNRAIVTIEGLGTPEEPHPIQQAFIDEQAVQCGFCTPGLVLAAKALLDRNPHPTADEVRAALASHTCRCGVHDRAVRAVLRASGQSRERPPYQVRRGEPAARGHRTRQPFPSPLEDEPSLDSWIRIESDGHITVFTGKIEFGQGIRTALAQIAAEELDVSIDRIRIAVVDTEHSPDEGYTVSSVSLETSGNAVRYAAAQARSVLVSMAGEQWDVPVEHLDVIDGSIRDVRGGRRTTYWDLMGGRSFRQDVPRAVSLKSASTYVLVGQPLPRLDLVAKATGRHQFVHDLAWPRMVHARVVRPPNQWSCLVSVDESVVEGMPGAPRVVRDGEFLSVLAEREEQAVDAMAALRDAAVWELTDPLPTGSYELPDHLFRQSDQAMLLVDGRPVGDSIPPIRVPEDAAHTLEAEYFRPYQRHASLAPSAAAALMKDGKLIIWTHAQGVYPTRLSLSRVLRMPVDDIRVIHVEGPGCFGHNGADDAALDASLVARAVPGRHVLLKWTQSQEAAWEPSGPAMGIRMQASLDRDGRAIDWNHDVWSYAHWGRASVQNNMSGLLAAWHMKERAKRPRLLASRNRHGGGHRNADPLYAFPRRRIVKHFVEESPMRVGNLRSLGAFANVFAIESFIDELAHRAGIDPVEFRLVHLDDRRGRDVIEAAASAAGWEHARRLPHDGHGRGLAFAQYKNLQSYVAVAVELTVNEASGRIHLERAFIAADAGQIVNPDGLSSQLEGGFLQGASWTLREEVAFSREDPIDADPPDYSVLGFPDVPTVQSVLINRPGMPYLGCGEAAPLATGAAIANAVFDAAGIRLRRLPFTPERVLEAQGA